MQSNPTVTPSQEYLAYIAAEKATRAANIKHIYEKQVQVVRVQGAQKYYHNEWALSHTIPFIWVLWIVFVSVTVVTLVTRLSHSFRQQFNIEDKPDEIWSFLACMATIVLTIISLIITVNAFSERSDGYKQMTQPEYYALEYVRNS